MGLALSSASGIMLGLAVGSSVGMIVGTGVGVIVWMGVAVGAGVVCAQPAKAAAHSAATQIAGSTFFISFMVHRLLRWLVYRVFSPS